MAEPQRPDTLPTWGSDGTYSAPGEDWDGQPNTEEVPEAKRDEGFEPNETVHAQYLNWILNIAFGWIDRIRWFHEFRSWRQCFTDAPAMWVYGLAASSDTGGVVAVGDDGSGNGAISYSRYGQIYKAQTITVSADHFKAVVYDEDNDLWIAVGENGRIMTSPSDTDPTVEGVTWTARTSGVSTTLNAVAMGNGDAMTVGNTGTVVYSANGTSWSDRTSDVNADTGLSTHFRGVCWDGTNDQWVVVGDSGKIITCPDDDTTAWTALTSGTTQTLYAVCWDQATGNLVAVGDEVILYSDDGGATWTILSVGEIYFSVISNGVSVLAGSGSVMRASEDGGATWTSIPAAINATSIAYSSASGWCTGGNYAASGDKAIFFQGGI